MKTWLKNPLSILAENAGGGILLEGSCIIELVPAGKEPSSEYDSVFDAGRHVIKYWQTANVSFSNIITQLKGQ